MQQIITFRVNAGADGAWRHEGTDYEAAHAFAREYSAINAIRQAYVYSSRSGRIALYQEGEMVGYLSGSGAWVTL